MTGHARIREALPTFAAGTARAFLDALARLGHDVSLLLDAAALRPGDLDDPDARIPCSTMGALLAIAQQRRPVANRTSGWRWRRRSAPTRRWNT
jgi:hypothetical protein